MKNPLTTTRRKVIAGIAGGVLVLGAIGAATADPEIDGSVAPEMVAADPAPVATEPVVTDAPEPVVTEPVVTEAPAPVVTDPPEPVVTEPAVTVPAFPEYAQWIMDNMDDISDVLDHHSAVAGSFDFSNIPLMHAEAVALDGEFTALYMDSPETGSPLSIAYNQAFLDCGISWMMTATLTEDLVLTDSDAEALIPGIQTCTASVQSATQATNDFTDGL